MQDRLKNCAKSVEAEEKGVRKMWRNLIFGAAGIVAAIAVASVVVLTGGAAAVALGGAAVAVASTWVSVVACASIAVGICAATDKEFMDTMMSEATKNVECSGGWPRDAE